MYEQKEKNVNNHKDNSIRCTYKKEEQCGHIQLEQNGSAAFATILHVHVTTIVATKCPSYANHVQITIHTTMHVQYLQNSCILSHVPLAVCSMYSHLLAKGQRAMIMKQANAGGPASGLSARIHVQCTCS